MALVSRADPGFFATFKESVAGSRALAAAPEGVRDLLKAEGFPTPPRGTAEEVTRTVMDQLGAAVGLLQGKAPEQVEGFKAVVLGACDAVANASKGVAPEESAVIDQVRSALADAEPGPASAEDIEGRHRLGQDTRVAVGDARDEGAELDAGGERRGIRQGGVRLEHVEFWRADHRDLEEVVHHPE